MSNVLGIDLSLTGTGLALITPDFGISLPGAIKIGTSAGSRYASLTRLATEFIGFQRWEYIVNVICLWANYAQTVVIEGYSFGSDHRVRDCIEIGGIVKFHLAKFHPA